MKSKNKWPFTRPFFGLGAAWLPSTCVRVFVVLCLFGTAGASSYYDYDIVAQVGQSGLIGIGDRPSINSKGTVAFVGQTGDGEALFVGKGGGLPSVNISSSFLSSSGRFFGRAVWINDLDEMVGYDRTFTHIRKWDANGLTGLATLAEGGPSTEFDQYDIVFDHASINNFGQIVFSADPRGSGAATALVTQSGIISNVLTYPFGNPIFRPVIADSGHVVVRAGSQATSPIHRYVYDLTTGIEIANSSMGFTQLGKSPGITDDGSIVGFAGNRGNGQGVFVSLEDSAGGRIIVRVAGENQPDLGLDLQGQPLHFSSIDADSRVAVARLAQDPSGLDGDTLLVAFIATPSAASPSTRFVPGDRPIFSAAQGLWVAPVRLISAASVLSFRFVRVGVSVLQFFHRIRHELCQL